MLPAQQSFGADYAPGPDLCLRLEDQEQLAVAQCLAQMILRREALDGAGIEILGVVLVGVAPALLGVGDGDRGVLEQHVHAVAVGGAHGDADAGRNEQLPRVDTEWIRYCLENAASHQCGVFQTLNIGYEQRELVAAEAGKLCFFLLAARSADQIAVANAFHESR